ncbi:TonB-dependent receptor [Chitinophaga oryzae]|uniref:TonB-dependent receptor n=1 Tax=Chitinophaga oryzae TaxID=2725414 RepID=A0ABX6LNX4_9BACT|nr:TonB-dependent receptor [Chitinophaga oryzae]QJB41703.1 TonB-dependent receptor [Chitinophaga oryzae]
MNTKKIIVTIYSFLLLMLASMAGIAQETSGGLTGKVQDGQGQALPGATIIALHEPSGTRYPVISDAGGRYHILGMRIGGPYTVTVTMMGMAPQKYQNVTVRLGEPQQLNVVLNDDRKQLSEVVVKGAKAGPKANNYGAGQNISRSQINNMPTVSRSIQDITRMVPQGSKDNSFGGSNFRYNNVTIDGAINNDAIGFSPSMGGQSGTSGQPGSSTRTNPVSLDAIEDMQVYLAPFDVKIGNFTGGSVNAVTRSGTNTFTGSVYGFGRTAAMIGKNKAGNGDKMNSDFKDYQAGIRLGFPIIKNKLFFFTNEEITRRTDPAQLLAGKEETARILSGKDADDIRQATIKRYGDIFDPGTPGMYNSSSESNKFFNRIDWNINDKHQLSVRNNTITSSAISLDRDQQDFRFGSMAFKQTNNQSSTVAELKSRFNNAWSNSFVAGFTTVHDYRDPLSDPTLPQVQIMGRTPGTTIYLGTDREASVFNMKQRTIEITNNLTWTKGKHTVLMGMHNELYHIDYGFVNAWNGRVDYLSIDDYLRNTPYRVRGSYNYTNNSRDYIMSHPGAVFNVNLYSVYIQDAIRVTDKLTVTPGLRADYTHLPTKPELSDKVTNAIADPYFGSTYHYTPLNRIENRYFGKVQISPRLGFRYDWLGDQSLIVRGGVGMFTGRIPFAWLAYAYYNNGVNYGSFDQKADQKPFAPGSDAIKPGKNGIADFIEQNGTVINNPNAGKTQVDLIDNDFVMPKILRASLAIDRTTASQWKFGIEAMVTKSIKEVFFQQVNITDNPKYYAYDKDRQQPVYSGNIDPHFSNAYLLSNTNKGFRYSITGTASKNFSGGLYLSGAYTYGQSKDAFNGIRNSMESNWQLNQALSPNNAPLAYSNFDIRHRFVVNTSYRKAWNETWVSTLSLFFSAQSGSPFTYGVVNNSVQGLPQQVSLAYIPQTEEAIRFFRDYTSNGQQVTAAEQAEAFNRYVDGNKYLNSRRGNFTERNMGRTPWNVQADLHFAQEFHLRKMKTHFITFTADVVNLTNLLNRNWGISYFSPNTFNSTASVGLTPTLFPPEQNKGGIPVYTFSDPGTPYSIDYFGSRYQVQLGLRYTF